MLNSTSGPLAGCGFNPIISLHDQPRDRKRTGHSFSDPIPCHNQRGAVKTFFKEMEPVANILRNLWNDESGQDIAEYAVMLAVILVIVVGTIRLIGSNVNNVFSNVGSAIQ